MLPMSKEQYIKELCSGLVWDYSISAEDIYALINGERESVAHYNRSGIFRKSIETYPWFTVLELFSPEDINDLLTDDLIKKLRTPSLRKSYAFIKRRLQETLPVAG
jgi:hypothetical protein